MNRSFESPGVSVQLAGEKSWNLFDRTAPRRGSHAEDRPPAGHGQAPAEGPGPGPQWAAVGTSTVFPVVPTVVSGIMAPAPADAWPFQRCSTGAADRMSIRRHAGSSLRDNRCLGRRCRSTAAGGPDHMRDMAITLASLSPSSPWSSSSSSSPSFMRLAKTNSRPGRRKSKRPSISWR
jgi:hypothetical protein